MLFFRIERQIFVLFQIFWILNVNGKLIINSNDWEEITSNWPIITDELSKEFFYFKPNSTIKDFNLMINNSIKSQITDQNQHIILSFKYWQSPIESQNLIASVKFSDNRDRENLVDIYRNRKSKSWMERKYVLSKESIDQFSIQVFSIETESIISMKDFKIQYDVQTNVSTPSHKMNYQLKPYISESSTPEVVHSTETTLDDCYLKSAKPNCFDEIDPKTLEVSLIEFDTNDYCFNLEYSATDPAIIEAYFIIANNKLENKFFSSKSNTKASTETAKICLSDYLRIKSKNITVFFTANPIYEGSKDDIKLRIKLIKSKRIYSTQTLTYLPGFNKFTIEDNKGVAPGDRTPYKQWRTTGNIGIDFDGKKFKVEKASKYSANYRISSDWIKYTDKLTYVNMIYSLNAEPNILEMIRIMPKVCDEISHCFDVKILNNTKDKNDPNTMYFIYNLNKNLTNTRFIKLIFEIEYFDNKGEEISFDLENVHFGDPCFNVKTNDGNYEDCVSDPFNSIPNKNDRMCKQKYAGKNCDLPNQCWTPTVGNDPSKISGEKFCSNFGKIPNKHGLCYLDNEYKFKCICEKVDLINWNSNERKCQQVDDPKVVGWTKAVNSYSLNNKNNEMKFEFMEILTDRHNVCISFNYIGTSQTEITVSYLDSKDQEIEKISVYLKPNTSNKRKKICINDINLMPDANFKLKLVVENAEKLVNKPTDFTIKDFQYTVDDKKIMNMITSINDLMTEKNDEWNLGSFTYDQSTLSSKKVVLQTEWIEFNPLIKNSSYKNQITLSLKNHDQIKIYSYIVYMDKNLTKKANNSVTKKDETRIILNIPETLNGAFRLVLVIDINVTKVETNEIEIRIKEISIGNPCSANPCKNNNCTPQSVEKYECSYNNNACSNNICAYCPTLFDQESKCTETGEDSYDCEVFDNYFTYKAKSCIQNFAYNTTNIECHGENCKIFDNLSSMKYASSDVPQFDKKTGSLYFTSTNGSRLSVGIDGYDAKHDFCLKLSYAIMNNSFLALNIDDNRPLVFSQLNVKNDKKLANELDFCLSDLSKTIKATSIVNIVPILGKTEFLSVVFEKPVDESKKNFTELQYLIRKVEYNLINDYWEKYQYKDQWRFQSPTKSWNVEQDGSITFSALPGCKSSLITTNWIEKYKKGLELRFKIKYLGNSIKVSTIQFIVLDENLEERRIESKDFMDENPNPQVKITIPDIKTSFRVGMRVNYTGQLSKEEILFKISDLDIGDPCIENDIKNTPIDCGGAGYCERKLMISNYTCHCKPGKNGTDCELIDYCGSPLNSAAQIEFPDYTGTGEDYCHAKTHSIKSKCNPGGVKGFYCDCENNQFWDPSSESCAELSKCIYLNCNSLGQFCNSTSIKCECSDGYKTDPKNLNNCLKTDPCDDKKKCNRENELNAICISNSDNTDYSCVCKHGYENNGGDKDDIKCESNMCNSPILNNCEQICVPDNKVGFNCTCDQSYDRKDNKCSKKNPSDCKQCTGDAFCIDGQTECQCKQGYKFNENKCEPDSVQIDTSICPGEIKYNNNTSNWECDCGQGFNWDNKKRICTFNAICSANSDGRNNCTKKNALCQIHLDKLSSECICPFGLHWIDPAKNKTKCVNFCQINDKISSRCGEINGFCDQAYSPKLPITDLDIKNAVFCKCNPGYYYDGTECVVGKNVVKFTLEFRNNFLETNNQIKIPTLGVLSDNLKKSSLFEEIQNEIEATISENNDLIEKLTKSLQEIWTNEIILQKAKIFARKTSFNSFNSFSISSCKLNKDLYTCEFVLDLQHPLDLSKKDILKDISLSSFCIPVPNETDYCFIPENKNYFFYDIPSYFPIIINKKALGKSEYIMPCTDRVVNCEGNSYCEPDPKGSTGYSCVCGKDFTAKKMDQAKFGQTNTYDCEVDEAHLCKSNCPGPYKDGYCTIKVNNDKISPATIEYRCGCKQNFKMTNNSAQCIDACDGIKCNQNGKCQYSGLNGYQCVCNEGYYGESCEKEQTLSKGGWIAGIVVLAVLVVIVSGVAFMFARRSRNNSQPEMGRPMDDYTGSSYRVPTQSRGQSNPSFN